MSCRIVAAVAFIVPCAVANANIVFGNGNDNGFFTPFNSNNAATAIYGDSGWFGNGNSAPETLRQMTMGLATFGGSSAGTTDIILTLNDGDPSGLVFGTGSVLYTTTITNVTLPSDAGQTGSLFSLTVNLPDIATTGGFNNIGWSVRLANYNYGGSFGFQVGTASSQYAGFYTNNASFSGNGGANWSLFSFGDNPNFGVANYTVSFSTVPAPGAMVLLGAVGLAGKRRR